MKMKKEKKLRNNNNWGRKIKRTKQEKEKEHQRKENWKKKQLLRGNYKRSKEEKKGKE